MGDTTATAEERAAWVAFATVCLGYAETSEQAGVSADAMLAEWRKRFAPAPQPTVDVQVQP